MPTRAAAAAAAAANKRTTRSHRPSTQPKGKENGAPSLPPSSTTKPKEKPAPKKSARIVKAKKVEELFCSCRGVDDGTPMVQCGTCDEWYHFQCIQLSQDDASEIMVYVCPTCQEKTGRRTVMEWEGLDALEPIEDATTEEPSQADETQTKGAENATKAEELDEPEAVWKLRQQRRSPAELSESSDDESGDEYVDEGNRREDVAGRHQRKRLNNRRIAAGSSSDSEEENETEKVATTSAHARRANVASTKTKTVSTSPQPGILKRKQSISATGVATASNATKRKRAESLSTSASAAEDAARKYCLGKFAGMFMGIFMQYPYVQENNTEGDSAERKNATVERKPEELTEEDKTQLRERASAYATEVEQAVFDTYAEPDKFGKSGAGVKYKERFRTLTFNLQQPDRVALHKRISSRQVAPATLATMSSTELASQEQQESIKQAEQEALEHSILIKATVPRAKITHKGLQDIEYVNEDSAIAKQRERELEMAEQERERERERLARLRTVQPQAHTHSNPPSASVPPESPVVPSSTSGAASAPWGAPPPVPLAQSSDFAHAIDPELNLGDFIHIDDEPPESTPATASTAPAPDLPSSVSESSAAGQGSGQQRQSTPMTGISPFAPSKPDMPPRASFDLNALWSASPPPPTNEDDKTSGEGTETNDSGEAMDLDTPTPPVEEGNSRAGEPAPAAEPEQGGVGGVEHEGEGGDDLDFAMFLGQEEEEKEKERRELASRPDPHAIFEGLPHVWNGIISMPTDSSLPQELRVIARHIGGRGLASDSPLWRTLFPLDHLRIDGRVAVESSAQYLLASRLNSAKELIAVAWTPVSDADMAALKSVSSFLINKDRHGLIFPWGSRGREWGRELYVIPLLSSHALPEFIEILDGLHLPQTRSADCLVGIYVLNRGRLNALPPPPSLSGPPQPGPPVHPFPQSAHAGQPLPFLPPGQQASVLPPALASALASIMPAGAALPNAAPAALAAALSHIPAPPPLVTSAAPSTVAAPVPLSSQVMNPQPSAAELAAKVASLTPEQIQAMLVALQQQQQPPSAPPQPQQLLPVPPQSSQAAPIHLPGGPPLPWATQPPPTIPMQKSYGGIGGHDEREHGGGFGRRGGYYARGRGRGGAGGPRGGGDVGGRADARSGDFRRMSDAGWSGRGGRGAGASSPSSSWR